MAPVLVGKSRGGRTTRRARPLEHEGFTRREPDPTNRRAVLVQLTEQGTERMEQLLSANVQHFTGLLDQLALSDLRALDQGITALNAVLQERGAHEAERSPSSQRRA